MKKLIGFCLWLSLPTLANVIPTEPHIYVEGYAEQLVYPDQVKTTVDITELNMDPELAKQRVEQKAKALLLALQPLGIGKEHISAAPLSIEVEYDYENKKKIPQGTRVGWTVEITLPEPAKYSLLMDVLVKAGINDILNSVGVIKDERAIKKQVAMLALKEARQKAEDMAATQDKKIKDVYSISEFKTRSEAQYNLTPTQSIDGALSSESFDELSVTGVRRQAVFEVSAMKASAVVYVVYTLK
ncbi:SIMPL domain-containing protein [Rheinheimera sp. MM224]|uniref:SIMPL domain-containing protein n=1 Tax=Rheinheimera sp. MM224 TaxID=3019969 RepID=UPI0021F8DA07|nr:SIMPL domain-containing protein [Rheinheimera sp. MM224]CAI3805817.1 hypothetical protein JAMGFMIE_03973 [Rheinheimera sp. MM224]